MSFDILSNCQAVIFDMDGVLVDSEPIHVQAEKQVCFAIGIDPPHEEWERFKGMTTKAIFGYLASKYMVTGVSLEMLVAMKTRFYLKIAQKMMMPVPGAAEFVRSCRERYPHIALATSSRRPIADMTLERLQLFDVFDTIVTADDVHRGKPHPDPYLLACRRLEVTPGDCLVVEDSGNGIVSAKTAGCQILAITTSHDREVLLRAGADLIIDSFSELIEEAALLTAVK